MNNDSCSCASKPGNGDLVLSIKLPGMALGVLQAEQMRRRHIFWTMKSGKLIDVTEMDDAHLENTIAMLERVIVSNEAAKVAAEEAYGDKEW